MDITTNRRVSTALLLLLVTTLLLALVRTTPVARAASPWSNAEIVSQGGSNGIYPDFLYDDEGTGHLVYTSTPDFRESKVFYRNIRNGIWSNPVSIFPNLATGDLPKISAVSINGKVRLAIVAKGGSEGGVTNSRIQYRESRDGGATWLAAEQVTGSATYEPDVALDDKGKPHITFTANTGGGFHVLYTTRPASGTGWTSGLQLSPGNASYNNYSTITYTRKSSGQLVLHVLHMGSSGGGDASKTVYYTRKTGSNSWTAPRVLLGASSNFPDIETDHKGRIHAVWQASIGINGYEPYYTKTSDHGTTWSSPVAVGWLSSAIDARPAIGMSASGDLVVAWDTTHNNSGLDLANRYRKTGSSTWAAPSWISQMPGGAKEVDVAGGLTKLGAVWHENPTGSYTVYFSTRSATPGVSGKPTIGTSEVTNNITNLQVSFSQVFGSPNRLRYGWDTEPLTATFVTLSNPFTLPAGSGYPSGLDPAVCSTHRLYTQLKSSVSGQTQSNFSSDTIVFDLGIQAAPTVTSPTAPGAPDLSSVNQIAYPTNAGRADMIRGLSYLYKLAPEPAGCAGLQSYRSIDGGSTYGDPLHTNAGGTYYGVNIDPAVVGLTPEGSGYAETSFVATLNVTDTLGNYDTINTTLYYDDDPPVVASGTAIVNNSGGTSATATVSWSSMVTDDYSTFVGGVNANNAYWGIWVLVLNANAYAAANADGDIDAEDFAAYGAKVYSVTTNSTQAVIKLASSSNPNTGTQPGPRYIYVRFLDGAGNFSANQLENTATALSPGYTP